MRDNAQEQLRLRYLLTTEDQRTFYCYMSKGTHTYTQKKDVLSPKLVTIPPEQ